MHWMHPPVLPWEGEKDRVLPGNTAQLWGHHPDLLPVTPGQLG